MNVSVLPTSVESSNPAQLQDGGSRESNSNIAANPALDYHDPAARNTEKRGLSITLAPAEGFRIFGKGQEDRAFHSQIAILEILLSYGKNTDPRNVFLLVNAYLSAKQQAHGIRFFEIMLARHGNTMSAALRAVHLAGLAILRATHADKVPLYRRVGWVRDTIALLDRAIGLSAGEAPLVRWARGIVFAQLPFFFFKRRAAYDDLNWLADRPETEPQSGFYREVYRHLSLLHAKDGDTKKASEFLQRSGYEDYQPKSLLMGWFTATQADGATMAASPWLEIIVPERVFAVHGFGFSELHFVVSDDGNDLIAIDAGTQPFSLRKADEFLRAQIPDLPGITNVLITHAHWDHVGGHSYFRERYPGAKFHGRGNYGATVSRVLRTHSFRQFRGIGYQHEWISGYAPDIEVDEPTDIRIGGTAIGLIPVTGGETEDALLVHFPDLGVLFTGDVMMPYFGEPWVQEGFVDEGMDVIGEIMARSPTHILHGHHPLTLMYGPQVLATIQESLTWLVAETRTHVGNGYSVKDIVRLNLIPPALEDCPDAYLGFMAARDHLIARVVATMVGIWREDRTGRDPEGLDVLTSEDYGRALDRYFGLTGNRTVSVLRKMIDAGDNELALKIAEAALNRFGTNPAIIAAKEEAADQLRSATQFLDPFKFVAYSEMIEREQKPVGL